MIRIYDYDTPWEIACMLINATCVKHNCFTGKDYQDRMFDLQDLKRIGEHLINYVDAEQEDCDG